MSERMTDERRPSDEEWRSLRAGGAMMGAPDYVLAEGDRARASEVAKDKRIKELEAALIGMLPLCGGMVLTRREAEARTVAEAALRNIGAFP